MVVFHNNKELIIDATKAENTEVQYVDKEDMKVVESADLSAALATVYTDNNFAEAKQLIANSREFTVHVDAFIDGSRQNESIIVIRMFATEINSPGRF
mgnify:CR=1 FL=1